MDKYKTVKVIGDGTYGSVIKAMNQKTGEIVAIKKMKKSYYKWSACVDSKEVESLIILSHPNVVQLYEIILEKKNLHFVFEYLDQNVFEIMKDRRKLFPEHLIRNIIFQTLQGLAYMHKKNYFHRDLKPENLLCYNQTIKIADFGLAKECDSKPPFTDYVSTRWYRAPEILLRSPNYNAPIDIFALGAIMSELYTMKPLFPGQSEQDQMKCVCKVLGTPSVLNWQDGHKLAKQFNYRFPSFLPQNLGNIIQNASEDAIELIKDMLHWDPKKRPTASECLQYKFFQVKLPVPMNAPDVSDEFDIDASQLLDQLGLNETIQNQSINFDNSIDVNLDQFRKTVREKNNKQRKTMLQDEIQQQKQKEDQNYAANAQGFSDIPNKDNQQQTGQKISSISLLRKARYKAGVDTGDITTVKGQQKKTDYF